MGNSYPFPTILTTRKILVEPIVTVSLLFFVSGFYCLLFGQSIYFLCTRPHVVNRRLLLSWIISLFVISTCGAVIGAVSDTMEFFVAFTALRTENFDPLYSFVTEGTPAQTVTVSLSRMLYIIANCLADSILIHRLFVIWGSRKRVIVLPVLASFVTNAFGLASAVMITIGEAVDTSIPENWRIYSNGIEYEHGYYAANAAVNVALTLVIAGRIWWTTREARMVMGREIERKYKDIVAIILESGMLYPIFLIVHVALQESVSTVINVNLYPVIIQMAGIAPTLIIVRTSLRRKVENVEMMVSTVRFEPGVSTDEGVVIASSASVDLRRSGSEGSKE